MVSSARVSCRPLLRVEGATAFSVGFQDRPLGLYACLFLGRPPGLPQP
jgi:hypothetical protein